MLMYYSSRLSSGVVTPVDYSMTSNPGSCGPLNPKKKKKTEAMESIDPNNSALSPKIDVDPKPLLSLAQHTLNPKPETLALNPKP